MYGIVYKAVEEYVLDNFDQRTWDEIKPGDCNIIDQPYNDCITFEIAKKLSNLSHFSINKILFHFGEYIVKISREKYLLIKESREGHLKDYLLNLPSFHNRMLLIYPKLTPPEFKVTAVNDTILMLHYYTSTPGMKEYIRGYLNGLVNAFENKVVIEHVISKQLNRFEDVFKISW
ncbi:heme NO-binding domain-containing protein [Flavobacterium aestuarii]|uniref:heme NO-binding domain-containing protein n=1 Tax=Flavobacterium aestuarii TaxID=3149227 RepID=UPI0032B3E25C